jgi:hypothetical protein
LTRSTISLFFGVDVLATEGSAEKIVQNVKELAQRKTLTLAPFAEAISYFWQRYYYGNELTNDFYDLQLRKNDRRDLVERVLKAATSDEIEILSGVLIIVYRLRNNLFHGKNWRYGIKGQFDNFRHANTVLMAVMELHNEPVRRLGDDLRPE